MSNTGTNFYHNSRGEPIYNNPQMVISQTHHVDSTNGLD